MGNRKYKINLNSNTCKACGICITLCSKKVFSHDENNKAVPVDKDKCTGCRLCEYYCPDYCIEVEEIA